MINSIQRWYDDGGAMPAIRKGYSTNVGDLRFEFHVSMIHVYALPNHNHVGSFSVIDSNGLPRVGTVEDFESAIMFWLDDHNAI